MLSTIASPTLLVNQEKVRHNLQRMADRCLRHGLVFRPHFKTHQSREAGEWAREFGVEEITVTSLRMAREFAAWGWKNITIAMPVNPREISGLNELSTTIDLGLFLVDRNTAAAVGIGVVKPIGYFIELDAGYGRSGVNIEDLTTIAAIIEAAGHHHCRGFYVHSGHTYDSATPDEITSAHAELLDKIGRLKKALPKHSSSLDPGSTRNRLKEAFEFAIGDTPACGTQENFGQVTSIGPGNFFYYDLVQAGLGVCSVSDIAVCLAAPVVQVLPERGEAIVHAGWVQLGKDRLPDGSYGRLVRLAEDGTWGTEITGAEMVKLSQEHGTARLPAAVLADLKPGDLIGILPVHACATVHGMRAAGEQRIVP